MPQRQYKYRSGAWFVGGALTALLIVCMLIYGLGFSLVSPGEQSRRQIELTDLRRENLELTEELLAPGRQARLSFASEKPPYDDDANARQDITIARERALSEGRYLMVTFGANWCLDCRTLHHNLKTTEVADYTRDLFHFVNVSVGKFNHNRDIAEELGVSLSRGIPVAIIFDPNGQLIGTTNEGQLEPSRHYTSKQILKFVRDIAERQKIQAPDDWR